ncbi:uncharacterized protein DS421_20g701570 [Arachis hypogaea]|nr:uncharacterized protein DS421_20g701570 [Arachis hypogaea]
MASRYRSLSRPAFTLIKSTLTKPTATPKPSPSLLNTSTSSSSSAALSRQSLVGFSAGVRAVPASAALGGVFGAPDILPRR